MKILILCGSLEPGRDGVGDYVRTLADQLGRDGACRVSAMAIRDAFAYEEVREQTPAGVPLLRIPAAWKPERRLERALQYTREYRPDWISIQFVPYSFHPKGLPVYLVRQLRTLTRDTRVHIMIHETWAGAGYRPGRILGSLMQKALLKTMLDRLGPAVIHTHLPEFQKKLGRMNHTAWALPLFSNIPVVAAEPPVCGKLVIGFFSQVDCSPLILEFLDALTRRAFSAGLRAELLLIGGQEPRMREFSAFLRGSPAYRDRVICTGFLSPAEISAAIRRCTVGITPVPRHALGKSGSVAAFLSHGIPVAAPHAAGDREAGFFSGDLRDTILTEPDLERLETARISLAAAKDELRVGTISRRFLHDLKQHSDI